MRLLIYVGPVAMPPSSHQLLLPPTGKAHFQYFQWERMRPTHKEGGERERESSLGMSHGSWSRDELLTNSGQCDRKGCLLGLSKKIFLTDRGVCGT